MPPHPLTNFEIVKYYENESRFNGVYSRDNLHNKIKDVAYVINLDEYSNIGTHWIAFYVKNNDITYFDSFGVEGIPKEIIKFIGRKNVIANILTEQTKLRLSEVIGTENYFYQEINERKSYIKKLNKYITIFEDIDKILIIFKCNKRWSINYFSY